MIDGPWLDIKLDDDEAGRNEVEEQEEEEEEEEEEELEQQNQSLITSLPPRTRSRANQATSRELKSLQESGENIIIARTRSSMASVDMSIAYIACTYNMCMVSNLTTPKTFKGIFKLPEEEKKK